MLEGAIEMLDTWAMIFMLDEGDDWTTDISLRKANPNYDVSVSGEFLRARQSDAIQSARKQNTFRTKHLNEWVGAKDAWMNISKWNLAPKRKPLAELEGRQCYIAVDLATKIDMVATVLLFPPIPGDPYYHVHARYYLPDARVLDDQGEVNTERYQEFDALGLLTLTMGEVVDFEVIEDDLREFAGRFDVQEVPYDPWQAAQLAQNMERDGLLMVEMRKTVKNLSEPMKQIEALVLQKLIAHGDCPVMNWMISNVVASEDAKENIYPNKERSENKIDGVVALIMAMARAIVHQTHGDVNDYLQEPIIA
jgi:phage terminase large subunit-like protein